MRVSVANLSNAINHPFLAGIVAVLLIAAAILIVGDSSAERSVVRSVSSDHRADLSRFSSILHSSGLPLSGADAPAALPDVAETQAFDTAVQRAMFGLRATRLDLYTLDGQPLYSTAGSSAPNLRGSSFDAFTSATGGEFSSLLRPPSSSQADLGDDAEILQSFTVIRDVSPESVETGRALLVAAISTDISGEINAAYNTIWLIVGIFTVGSMVILAAVHWVSVRSKGRLEEANAALAVQNEAVRDSRERMIAAADMTKRAIAEELHGTVQTKIFALWMRLDQFKSRLQNDEDTDLGELTAIIEELDAVRENDIRGLSHRLHPSIVRVGAAPALKSLCSAMSGAVKVELDLEPSAVALEPLGASQIPEEIRLAIYRIAELAIGNTIKHASASKCTVNWSYMRSDGQLQLIVRDDGVGFDPEATTSGGLGIVNIQDYTDALGGQVTLTSKPGEGTVLRALIPFNAPPDQFQAPSRPEPSSHEGLARAA